MKWHELGETYGYPVAFRWPTWKEGDYIVARDGNNLEAYRANERVEPKDEILGTVGSLYFYWYEHDKWEPMFGFY